MNRKLTCIIKNGINTFLTIVSLFIIRSQKIVVCGGWFGKRFADNSKAFFLFLSDNKEKLGIKKVCYITKNKEIYKALNDKGFDCFMSNSIKGFWYQLVAKYHIVDQNGSVDLNRFCSVNALRINLWHGFPLKRIGYHIEQHNHSLNEVIHMNNQKIEISHWNKFYNLVLSNKHKELQQFAFGLEDSMMIKGVYPRTLYMLGNIQHFVLKNDLVFIRRIKSNQKKVIGYFPTFRDHKEQNVKCAECIQYLNKFAEKNNYLVITKLHFASNVISNFDNCSHIINLNSNSDVYDYLKYIDVMISDYSSIIFDYILFNKPIIYYAFDLDNYKSCDRGFLFEYEDMCAGEIVQNIDKLDHALIKAIEYESEYLLKYQTKVKNIKEIVYEDKIPTLNDLFDLWNKISHL